MLRDHIICCRWKSHSWVRMYRLRALFTERIDWHVLGEGTEKAMTPHSSTLAWKIPWMEEPGRLQSMGSRRVGHDWGLHFPFSLSCIGEGNGNPLQCSCLENPMDGGAWQAAVYGVAQSQTRLKWLSSSRPAILPNIWTAYYTAIFLVIWLGLFKSVTTLKTVW